MNNSRSWRSVGVNQPCPICAKSTWCRISPDGARVACRRQEHGAFKSKTDKNGTPVYLHRLDVPVGQFNSNGGSSEFTVGLTDKPLGADRLHAIYTALLSNLPLSKSHRENLQKRGLEDAEIDRRQYRTWPRQGRTRLAQQLRERFGDEVLRVPGIIQKHGENCPYLSLAGPAGLVVPVRDLKARIVALKIRRDESHGAGKYHYLSSSKFGGLGPGSPVHVPLGVGALARRSE